MELHYIPEIEADETIEYSPSYNVSFILRALGQWSSLTVDGGLVSLELITMILDSIRKVLIMLPPLERQKLPEYLLQLGFKPVQVFFALKDSLGKQTRFKFEASSSQAAEYQALSGVKILPVESSGFSLIVDIIDFILLPLDTAKSNKALFAACDEPHELDLSMESFYANTISDFSARFRTVAVSLDSTTFETSSNVAIEEVKKAYSFITKIQEKGFGVVGNLAPSLLSDNIEPIYDQFKGEISSYLSNKRNINTLLLENYPCSSASPLVNEVCIATLGKISKSNCYIPPRHVALTCRLADGSAGVCTRLEKRDGKPNLLGQSILKPNGTRLLDVKTVTLTLNGSEVAIPSKTRYNFCNESSVAPLVNAETAKYAGGIVEVRDLGPAYSIVVPIKLIF